MKRRFHPVRAVAQFIALAFVLLPSLGYGVPVRWTLSNVAFADGGTLSGFFVFDPDTLQFGARSLAVAGGNTGSFPPIAYATNNTLAYTDVLGNPQKSLLFQINDSFRQLRITPLAALTNTGGTVDINLNTAGNHSGSLECFNCGPSREIVSGRLTGVAEGPFAISPGMAGNWYDPAQDGHGVQIEVLPGGVATAFWFTFDNAGNQAWINGAGTINGDSVSMNSGRVVSGRFPPNFNPATIERRAWGTMNFRFTDCNHAVLTWTASDPAFTATGTMNLQRLTSLAGLSCPVISIRPSAKSTAR